MCVARKGIAALKGWELDEDHARERPLHRFRVAEQALAIVRARATSCRAWF